MKVLCSAFTLLVGCLRCPAAFAQEQVALGEPRHDAKQIAIAGAGAGGASAAYFLSRFASDAGIPVNISVFERNSYVGGRTTTVNAYDDPAIPVELGGSIFVEVNTILIDAVKEFNLSTQDLHSADDVPGAALGVWNGRKFVFTQEGNFGWWDNAKLLWKYGLVPMKVMRLMRDVVGKFIRMYDEPVFPFESLTQAAQDVGLLSVTAATGEQYIAENLISGDFITEIVQAATRVNYASNIRFIHALEAMVCMAAENGRAVQGGNWQIFSKMLNAANATVHLKNTVSTVQPSAGTGLITVESTNIEDGTHLKAGKFDDVILATPLQFSNISMKYADVKVDTIPYVELQVTLFTSPHLLSPAFFGMQSDKPVPKVILTTLPKDEAPERGPDGVGSPGFFSISLLHPVTNPKSGGQEYLYKIFSQTAPNATFLSRLLGFEHSNADGEADIVRKDISWIHRKQWNSYPYEYPRVTFENIKLAHGLWYTSGMDSFISTMETNALMGKNVARLIVDGWLKHSNGLPAFGEIEEPSLLTATDGM